MIKYRLILWEDSLKKRCKTKGSGGLPENIWIRIAEDQRKWKKIIQEDYFEKVFPYRSETFESKVGRPRLLGLAITLEE